MLGREVIEGGQDVAILDQAGARLFVFRPVLGSEAIEGLISACPAFGVVDPMKIALGLLLHRLRQIVQNIGRLVDLVHRRIHKIQLAVHYLFGFASTFTNICESYVWANALAALPLSGRPNLPDRLPETQRSIAGRELGFDRKAIFIAQAYQKLVPALLALAKTVVDRQEFFLAALIGAHQNQDALTIVLWG